MESDCVAQVRQSTGEQGEITLGDVRSVYTWAPGFLDGSQPSAQPVDTGDWAATATAAGKPVGLLEVVTDKGRTTCTPMFDDDLATDVDQMGDAHLIHDRNANAWYSLRGTTVTALGEAATRRLAGPIELSDYGEILRERAGSKPKTSATQSEARSATGGWAMTTASVWREESAPPGAWSACWRSRSPPTAIRLRPRPAASCPRSACPASPRHRTPCP